MKEIKVNIPEYDGGLEIVFENNCKIKVEITNYSNEKECVITANKEGLISLARQFLTLAQCPINNHYHLDSFVGLEDGSDELVICKDDKL